MARIDEYLQKILSARYGEEVRGAIHDSIDEINRVNEANISTVQTIADTAQGYADDAEDSKDLAAQSVNDAQAQVTLAQQQVTLATTQATNSANSAEDSEAWAVGQRGGIDVPSSDETYQNNSKYWQERANYWYQQAQAIAESFSGALRPMGTVTFENLPPLAQADSGDMYNISNQFTTTSDFVEGAGIVVPLGSNVYKTTGGKWDILAGSPVTGVKGNSESSYRRGNVNITKSNIGLGNVDNTSDENKPISTAQQTALNSKQNITDNSLTTTNKTIPGAINEINASLINYGQGHNAIFRGKDLGTVSSVASLESFLSSHKVSNGSFSDIYLGDIIHIQDGTYNAEWIVAGFNTHINKGNTNIVNVNHIALIPKTILFSDKMNSTNTTEGGYKASYMHTTVMATVTSKLNAVLGSHLLTRDILISNVINTSVTSGAYSGWTGASSGWEWVATRCELMSEVEVYGSRILSSSFYDIGEGCMKLPVFNFINHVQYSRAYFWLRGVAGSTYFCFASGDGNASGLNASDSLGVRPLILIG